MNEQRKISEDIAAVGKMMLWEYGNQKELNTPGHVKEEISLCWLSRTLRQLEAIDILAANGHCADGWICFRSLLERYLLYAHLCERNEFEVFDDWCFKKKYENVNMVKSNSMLRLKPEVRQIMFTEAEKERYKMVSADERVRTWDRPRMEDVAKRVEMKFLYDAGYDFASQYVHPVSDNGKHDYLRLMGRSQEIVEVDTTDILVGNARLIATMQIQDFMNQPGHNWRKVLYDLIDAMRRMIGGETIDYSVTLQKVVYFHTSGAGLCVRAVEGEGPAI